VHKSWQLIYSQFMMHSQKNIKLWLLCVCLNFILKQFIAQHHICGTGSDLFTIEFQLTKMQELSGLRCIL